MPDELIVVTGGAGFIGSALVRHLIRDTDATVLNVDALTYAANLRNVADVEGDARYRFEQIDIGDAAKIERVFAKYRPSAIIHLAAETHVDRSIDDPMPFVQTNMVGTATLLHAACRYWRALPSAEKARFRFLHVSTDEVYGSIDGTDSCAEEAPYRPNSPYAASKAGADHLVRAWHKTYGLPVIITNCSNNFGPYQFPEKLIPLMIINGLAGRPMPVYGRGENIRDWLFVEDHARALSTLLRGGRVGECYNVGGNNERRNVDVAAIVCDLLDELCGPLPRGKRRRELITFVSDRPGHDLRYALDGRKLTQELDWKPREAFETALRQTIEWYLANEAWWAPLRHAAVNRVGLAV
jgi:dTDP-glucose 4,6-dehydratase